MHANCTVTSSHQESLAVGRTRGSLRSIRQTAMTSRCSSPLLLSKLCAAAGAVQSPGQHARSVCRRGPHTLGARLASSKLVIWQMPRASLPLLVSAVRCHCPGCWPSVVEGVSWCSRKGRILMLQGGKEAQKVSWSFPCSSAGQCEWPLLKRGVCLLLKDFQCCRLHALLGTRHLPQITSSCFFSPQDPFFSLLVGRVQQLPSASTAPAARIGESLGAASCPLE